MTHKTAHAKGLMAESLASVFLRLKGYRILAHRHKTPVGEVDIIARKGKIICAIEVKVRPNLSAALSAISPNSTQRIRRSMQWWLKNNPQFGQNFDIRFDLVAIAPYHGIRHIKNAF